MANVFAEYAKKIAVGTFELFTGSPAEAHPLDGAKGIFGDAPKMFDGRKSMFDDAPKMFDGRKNMFDDASNKFESRQRPRPYNEQPSDLEGARVQVKEAGLHIQTQIEANNRCTSITESKNSHTRFTTSKPGPCR